MIRPIAPVFVALMVPNSPLAEPNRADGWSLGVIAAIADNPYVGEGSDVLPYPMISYRQGPLSIGTFGVDYDVYTTNRLSFSVGLTPRFTGLLSTDAPELEGVERKITGDLALGMAYEIGADFSADLAFRQELTGEHNGQELVVDLGYDTQLGKVGLQFSTGAAWQSKDLSRFMWGVSTSEARLGRPAYAPGNVVIPYAAANATLPVNDKWTLVGTVRVDFLPNEISDSPIVDGKNIYSLNFGATYSF